MATELSTLTTVINDFYAPVLRDELGAKSVSVSPFRWVADRDAFSALVNVNMPSGAMHDRRIVITGSSMMRAGNDRGEFLQALKAELGSIKDDIRKSMDKEMCMNSTPRSNYKGGFGRLYRIPVQAEASYSGDFAYRDVTKKQAKQAAKALEKHARSIRKAIS